MATVAELISANLSKRKGWQITDKDGLATAKLARAIKAAPSAVAVTLRRMESDGLLSREIESKRTYAIRLVKPLAPALNGSNGQAAVNPKDQKRQRQIDAVVETLQEHAALLEENANLQKELGKAEEKIEAQSLQIAALTRQVEGTKETAKLIAEIQEKLRKIG